MASRPKSVTFERAESVRSPGSSKHQTKSKKSQNDPDVEIKPKEKDLDLGQICDFWGSRANRHLETEFEDKSRAIGKVFDKVSDVIFGERQISDNEKKRIEMEEEKQRQKSFQRELRRRRAAEKQTNLAVVLGLEKSEQQIQEELAKKEEESLQLLQLDRLKERFEGELTLL